MSIPWIQNHLCVNVLDAEAGNFTTGWKHRNQSLDPRNITETAWIYQNSHTMDNHGVAGLLNTYPGGGYMINLYPRWNNTALLQNLEENLWLDRYTKALLFEFTLFTPGTEMYQSSTVLFESLPSGGVVNQFIFMPLQPYVLSDILKLLCEVLFIMLVMMRMMSELKLFHYMGLSYLCHWWNILNTITIVLSILSSALYFYRYNVLFDLIHHKLALRKPDTFINMYHVGYINHLYVNIKGTVIFLIMIGFVKFMQYVGLTHTYMDALKSAQSTLRVFMPQFGMYFLFFTLTVYQLLNQLSPKVIFFP